MATYSGSIGSVNVLDFASTDIFDDTQENPFLLKQHVAAPIVPTVTIPLCAKSVSPRKQSVTFGTLPLIDELDLTSSGTSSPQKESMVQSPSPIPVKIHSPVQRSVSMANPVVQSPNSTTTWSNSTSLTPSPSRASITLPYQFLNRQESSNSNTSTVDTVMDHEMVDSVQESELHKLLYTLARLGISMMEGVTQPQPVAPTRQSQQFELEHVPMYDYEQGIMSAPTSPVHTYSSLWRSGLTSSEQPEPSANSSSYMETQNYQEHVSEPPATVASLTFRSIRGERQSRRTSKRKSARSRSLSAPSSPVNGGDYSVGAADDNSLYGRPRATSRGSVTFTTVKNLLRGGGALARTVHRESQQRPRCMGTDHTSSTKRKQRQKFQRPTVITDASHRVSTMRLGTSPMKSKCKHTVFPGFSTADSTASGSHDTEADPGMPSPTHPLHHNSLITLETLDMIGTRHASPVHLIEHPLPDYSNVSPRVDTWNDYKKPKKTVRLPSSWLLEVTKTPTSG